MPLDEKFSIFSFFHTHTYTRENEKHKVISSKDIFAKMFVNLHSEEIKTISIVSSSKSRIRRRHDICRYRLHHHRNRGSDTIFNENLTKNRGTKKDKISIISRNQLCTDFYLYISMNFLVFDHCSLLIVHTSITLLTDGENAVIRE